MYLIIHNIILVKIFFICHSITYRDLVSSEVLGRAGGAQCGGSIRAVNIQIRYKNKYETMSNVLFPVWRGVHGN